MNRRSFHNIWWVDLLRGSGHMKGYQRIFEQKLNQKILYIFECLSISGFKLIRNTFSIYKTLYLKWLKSTTLINQSVEKCRRWCDEGKSILWPMVSHNLTVQCQCGLERIKKEYESYYMTQFVSIEGVSIQWSILPALSQYRFYFMRHKLCQIMCNCLIQEPWCQFIIVMVKLTSRSV